MRGILAAMISAVWMVALDSDGDVAAGWANVSSAPVFPVFVVLLLCQLHKSTPCRTIPA